MTKDIIDDYLNSIETLLKLMRKKINFDDVEPYKFKSIVEGRKQTFESAYNQITRVNQLEEADNIGSPDIHRARFQRLIDSTENFKKEVRKVATAEIDVDESDDDKVKSIVQSKDLALSLLEHVASTNTEIKTRIKDSKSGNKRSIVNFASDMVKGK